MVSTHLCSSNWIIFPLFSWWKFKKYLKLPTKQDHPSKWLVVSPLRTGLLPTPSKAPPFNAPQHSQGALRRTAKGWSGRDGFFRPARIKVPFFAWYGFEFGDRLNIYIYIHIRIDILVICWWIWWWYVDDNWWMMMYWWYMLNYMIWWIPWDFCSSRWTMIFGSTYNYSAGCIIGYPPGLQPKWKAFWRRGIQLPNLH